MSGKGKNTGDWPRLIEVALPIREISAESVRDKSLRHGHISTLHLWWARRPLAASRAVVFASLVPDPDDPRCPAEFRAAVERHLKTHVPAELKYYRRGRQVHRDEDPYRPYEGMPDTLRNRLLMFIAKWSPESLAFEAGKAKKEPDPKYLLDDRSLVKWETSDPENPQGREVLRIARELVKAAYGGETPTVLDPFAGGGSIPLEAGRLGCQAIANDYNPVAYLILRATCEFPQKYGRPGKRKVVVEEFGKEVEREIEVPNVLVHDVEKWANWIWSGRGRRSATCTRRARMAGRWSATSGRAPRRARTPPAAARFRCCGASSSATRRTRRSRSRWRWTRSARRSASGSPKARRSGGPRARNGSGARHLPLLRAADLRGGASPSRPGGPDGRADGGGHRRGQGRQGLPPGRGDRPRGVPRGGEDRSRAAGGADPAGVTPRTTRGELDGHRVTSTA
ncbi:MAG: hypothetical protein KatS3mg132_882 [Limisphaera sp.]|nr:MAG: hypothetical protein KatS3mg132_882 [Limisphaera sp.]